MKQADPLIRILNYHEEISEVVENYSEIFEFLNEKEAWKKVKPIDDFFKKNIISHFEFEEKIIFPTCLLKAATPEFIRLILELQREHGFILSKVEEWQGLIPKEDIPRDQENFIKINYNGREILDLLITHASKEDDKLLPFLKENRKIFGF